MAENIVTFNLYKITKYDRNPENEHGNYFSRRDDGANFGELLTSQKTRNSPRHKMYNINLHS
jgi:hypothetical protein